MFIFPAIDIRGGKCVRLVEGDFKQETVFSDYPENMALKWQDKGAEYLHIVDLDGALKGSPQNLEVIKNILEAINIPIQLGGGIRDITTIERVINIGVDRVILGSIAVKNPNLVKEAVKEFDEKIVVGIDAKNGEVAVEGWGISGDMMSDELACRMADVGVQRIVYTDISRDGTLKGVNAKDTAELAKKSGLKVIASGGAATIKDIKEVKKYAENGIEGIIIGKALYTGAIDLKEALSLAKE